LEFLDLLAENERDEVLIKYPICASIGQYGEVEGRFFNQVDEKLIPIMK
jgi:hypothetical protein